MECSSRHIQQQAVWLRANLNLPMDELLSFRIGNQIFFVFVNTAEFDYQQSSKCCSLFNVDGRVAWRMGGFKSGLMIAHTGKEISLLDFFTEDLIEMTDWELHDFAVQLTCSNLKEQGK